MFTARLLLETDDSGISSALNIEHSTLRAYEASAGRA
jgi:hypothetical protein